LIWYYEGMTVKVVASKIKQIHFKNKPVIIAIDGFGGAGKSTFAKSLKKELRSATIVEVDDFFLFGVQSDADKSNFDRSRLVKQVLEPLKNGKPASYQRSIDKYNPLSGYLDVPQVDYLILEGVSSFHPDITKYLDYKIWLDIPAEEAKKRMMNRDKSQGHDHGEELWNHWTDSYQAYKDLHHPEEAADLVVIPE
jgi:uridine kinase